MSKYEVTIGIECHVQLATKTKLFSEVDNDARGKEPNSCVSPVDYALPGMLPRLNGEAIKFAIRAGHAMHCDINPYSRFDRKHYFYPDSPKGYQITQFYHPIVGAGYVDLPSSEKVRIEHAHLEGDAGKLTHFGSYSLVDLNRVDTPLLEIVSMPDIHSAKDAHDYCKALWRLMCYAGVTEGDLYNGNMRFDVNTSLAKPGEPLGTRTEVKNLNSFRSVERAVEYEIKRQSALLDKGEKVVQETLGWSDATGETTGQRSKEEAKDYRYMPEPDLPPLNLSEEYISDAVANFPLMPTDYQEKFKGIIAADTLETLLDYPALMRKLGELASKPGEMSLSPTSAAAARTGRSAPVKTGGAERIGESGISPACAKTVKTIANLFASVLLAEEKSAEYLNDLPTAAQLKDLAEMKEQGELSSTSVKEVFLRFFDPQMRGKDAKSIAKELNLIQENDAGAIEAIVDEVIAGPACAKAVEDFKSGQEKVIGFLVGQVMKKSKGKANPAAAQKILREKLS